MPSTWEIEYRGTLADSAPGGDKRTLAAWGLSGIPELTMLNLARGNMVLTVDGSTSFLADLPWAYRDKIVLWRDGARYWHGWLSQAPRAAEPAADSISMVFADPWWWLEQTAMTDPAVKNLVIGNVSWEDIDLGQTLSAIRNVSITWAEPSGDIVWANWRDQARYTVQGCIRRAYYAAARLGAPIALGTIGIDAPAPAQQSAGNTALDYLVGACAYEPNAVGWWDYSGVTPTLHVQPRSALSALSYDIADCPAAVSCAPMYELQALAVRIRWAYPDDDGDDTTYIEHAGTAGLTGGPNVLVLDASVGSYIERLEAVSYGIAARMYAALGPLAYSGSLSLTDDTTPLAAARPGAALNLLSGRAEWATMAGIVQQLSISVVAEAESCSVQWGASQHLGINDWLDLARRLDGSAGGAVDPDSVPGTGGGGPSSPGTYDDLMPGGLAGEYTPAMTFEDHQRGGLCTLYGYSEWADRSTPVRIYLRDTLSGSSSFTSYAGGEPTGTESRTGSGSSRFDPYTGAVTSTKKITITNKFGTSEIGDASSMAEGVGVTGPDGSITITKLVRAFEQHTTISSEIAKIEGSCASTQTLSEENTEDAELARQKSTWTWAARDPENSAIYSARTTDSHFWWMSIRRRAKAITGLKPWGSYQIKFGTLRKEIDSATWIAGDPVVVSVTADLEGKVAASDWAELEAPRGWVADWAANPEVVPQ